MDGWMVLWVGLFVAAICFCLQQIRTAISRMCEKLTDIEQQLKRIADK